MAMKGLNPLIIGFVREHAGEMQMAGTAARFYNRDVFAIVTGNRMTQVE
jgi:hypothetical protein